MKYFIPLLFRKVSTSPHKKRGVNIDITLFILYYLNENNVVLVKKEVIMKLFDSDFNEVCAKWAVNHLVRNGMTLKPLEVKREIQNRAKEWGVPVEKVAEAHKLMFNYLAGMSDAKIDDILNSDKVEK